jgi:GNAT superfamily N-acetyltransferase
VLFEGSDKRDRMNRFLDERAARRAARAVGDAAADGPRTASAGERPGVPDPAPPFRVRQLTIEDGLAAASWSSPGAWRIEDALEAPEPDEGYWAVVDSRDNLIGFCCLGAAARVPGQPADEWVLDVTIGIRPQLAGRGWGGDLGRAAVAYARSVALDRRVRTTVPDWNDVGQHSAGQAGFVRQDTRVFHRQRYDVFEQPI